MIKGPIEKNNGSLSSELGSAAVIHSNHRRLSLTLFLILRGEDPGTLMTYRGSIIQYILFSYNGADLFHCKSY